MTIFQPHKSRITAVSASAWLLFLFLLASALGLMFVYNQLVNLRHNVSRAQDEIQKAMVLNADLKNNLYQIIDPKKLQGFADKQSFAKETNPRYFENNSLASNS